MTSYYAILDDEHNVVAATRDEWAEFFEDNEKRQVAYDEIRHGEATIKVSTVFLGLNHNLLPGPPLWFETMVFWPGNEGWDQYQERHENWQVTAYRHSRVLAAVKDSLRHYPPPAPGLAAQITAALLDDLEQQETDEPFIWPQETAHEAQD